MRFARTLALLGIAAAVAACNNFAHSARSDEIDQVLRTEKQPSSAARSQEIDRMLNRDTPDSARKAEPAPTVAPSARVPAPKE